MLKSIVRVRLGGFLTRVTECRSKGVYGGKRMARAVKMYSAAHFF